MLAVTFTGCGAVHYRNALNPSAGQVEFDRDWYACRQENTSRKTTLDKPLPSPSAPYAYKSRLVVDEDMARQCMAARGWQPVSETHNQSAPQEQIRYEQIRPSPPHIPRLALSSKFSGVEVWMDGQRIVPAGQDLVVSNVTIGTHRLRVLMPGSQEWAGEVQVTADDSVVNVDALVAAASPSPPAVSAPQRPAAPLPTSPREAAPAPGEASSRIRGCRSEATEVAGTADETDVWRRAFQVCVKRAGLIPLQPEAAAQVRALLACKSEVGEVADETTRTQRIRQCMATHGYTPADW